MMVQRERIVLSDDTTIEESSLTGYCSVSSGYSGACFKTYSVSSFQWIFCFCKFGSSGTEKIWCKHEIAKQVW